MTAPTLIVGLGGTGSKIVQKVYALATPAQRKNLSFVVFDTDINELRGITDATPSIKTVQTSAKLSVGEYLEADKLSRDTWFPVNKIMNRKALTEGAGQVRAISRLALNTTIQQGRMTPLEDAIKELYIMSGDKGNQALRVMLVGSLCGGTGSGLILPVSLYIRNYLKTQMQQGSAVIRGFFLLPEVFHKVITSPAERNNLACNAYAAIREIDAFFMLGDGSLPDTYDLHYMVPKPGSKEQCDIADSPMDFCFLYDASNIDAQELFTFGDYLDHAANCIYAQSIAPTSKRSNSSEDNVIGDVVREGGRNRYCGAGSSIIEYPIEDVKKYLTLIWARDNISSEWLEVDRDFKKQQKDYLQKKRDGINATPVNRTEHYISTVESGHKERKPFLTSVRNMCMTFKPNGFIEETAYWDDYISELERYIDNSIRETQNEEDVAEIIENCQTSAKAVDKPSKNSSGNLGNLFLTWYSNLKEYRVAAEKYTESLGERLAYSLFKDDSDYSDDYQPYRLEAWLKQTGDDNLLHPSAMRYFYSKVLKELEKLLVQYRGKRMSSDKSGDTDGGDGKTVESIRDFWDKFEINAFDDDETEDHIETADEYIKNNHLNDTEIFAKVLHRSDIESAKDELQGKMEAYYTKTAQYWEVNTKCIVIESAIKYLREMLAAFDAFYDVLDKKVGSLAKDIDELESKYVINDTEKDGKAVRYVCADKACLRALSDEVVNLGSSIDIPKELSKVIYNKVRRYAMSTDKPATERYFSDTYDNAILGYYTKSILNNYESTVCMDVLSAIGYEAKSTAYKDVDMTDAERSTYMSHVLDSVKHRARPFIDAPKDKTPRIIDACTYSKKLAEADEPGRKMFVSKQLGDFGGVADNDIDPNRIVFFRSIYSLKASELSKFKPVSKTETDDTKSGSYFDAYYERVGRLHPDPRKSHAITPHIDRWWHVISKLPDLDDVYQAKQQRDINAAFFWGLISDAISYEPVDRKNYNYRVNVDRFREFTSEDADLIVSNGTPCDTLYELLDAIMIYPNLVKVILGDASKHIITDINSQKTLEESYLIRRLAKFRVNQFPLKAQQEDEKNSEESGIRSIFEIPVLMKRSIPAEDYREEFVVGILNTELEEIRDFIHRFGDMTLFQNQYAKLLDEQYALFLKNTAEEDTVFGNIIRDNLYTRICNIIAREFEDVYQPEKAEEIYAMLKKKNAK